MRKAIALTTLVLALLGFGFAQSGIGVQTSATATATVQHINKGEFDAKLKGAQTIHWSDIVTITVKNKAGVVVSEEKVHNLVTNAGFDLISSAVSNTATQAAACNYVAVTNTAITPGAGDTTLSGEIASNGLTRAQGTYSHTNGTQTYTVSKVFTATGTQASQATGLFNASSSGSMCYEATYTQVTVNSGDTLTVTWTVTLS